LSEEDFDLNDMINFFSASGSGVKVIVMDEEGVVVLEKEKKEGNEDEDEE